MISTDSVFMLKALISQSKIIVFIMLYFNYGTVSVKKPLRLNAKKLKFKKEI